LAATGLRIASRYPNIVLRDWILFGALLCGAILTRHINSVLVALLPITIFLIALVRSLHKSLACRHATSALNFTLGRSARVWSVSDRTSSGTQQLLSRNGKSLSLTRMEKFRMKNLIGLLTRWLTRCFIHQARRYGLRPYKTSSMQLDCAKVMLCTIFSSRQIIF